MPSGSTGNTSGIKLGKKPKAVDPNLMATGGTAQNPAAAPLTQGPNRYTIRVPSHSTKLNLGQGDALETATRNQQIGVGTESGIVGQTDVHTHYHTFGTDDASAKTIVRLGIPPVSVPPTDSYEAGAKTGIGCLLPDAYSVWKGYSMVTQGASYQESRDNHVLVSSEGEVRVVADTVLSLSTPGDILIGANAYTDSKTLVENQHRSSLPNDFGNADLILRVNQILPLGVTAAALLTAGVALVKGVWTGFPVAPAAGLATWLPPSAATVLGVTAGFIGWGLQTAALAGQVALLGLPSDPRGRVGIFASSSATMSGVETASVFAGGAASMTAGVSVGMLGGVFASVTGLVSTSVSGIMAKMAGHWSASVESLWGGTEVKSCSDVKVYSTLGETCVTGQTKAQISSVLGPTYVYGMTGVTLSAAGTMGMTISPASLSLGAIVGPVLSTTFAVPTQRMTITPSAISLTMGASMTDLTPAATAIQAPAVRVIGAATVDVKAPITKISGGKVYLG